MKGTTMRPAHRAPLIASLAAAAVLGVAGCGSDVPPAGSVETPPVASVETPPAAVATPPASANAAGPLFPALPGQLVPFTFPDGHLSFQYPVEWHAEYFTGEGDPAVSGTATLSDTKGNKQVIVYYGQIADAVSHPVTRTVFESEPVPGLQGHPAPAAHYSFYVDRMEGKPTYRMHLTAGAPPAGNSNALDGIIRIGERVLVADVHFIENPFADDDAAKAWLAGDEGQALKALLLSMSYR
jgi:hypothetical protein